MHHTFQLAAGALLLAAAAQAAEPAPPAAPAGPALQALSDLELRSVARPAVPTVVRLPVAAPRPTWFKLPGLTRDAGNAGAERAVTVLPALFSADVVVKDVSYGPNGNLPRFNPDGSVTLALPATIGELDIRAIRPAGASASSNALGAIQLRGLDLGNTTIVVTPGK